MKKALSIDSEGNKVLIPIIDDDNASGSEELTFSGKYLQETLHSPFIIGTKEVDETNIGDEKILVYNSITDKLEYKTNDFLNPIDFTNDIEYTENLKINFSNQFTQIGKIVNTTINSTVKATNSYRVQLGTIPENIRPIKNITINTMSNKGKPCYVYIDPTGEFGLTLINANEWVEGDGCRMTFSYTIV